MVGDREYPRCGTGHRPCPAGAVLCRRRCENVRELCGIEKAGTRSEIIYPLRACQRRCHLWLAAYDGAV